MLWGELPQVTTVGVDQDDALPVPHLDLIVVARQFVPSEPDPFHIVKIITQSWSLAKLAHPRIVLLYYFSQD